MDLMKRSIITLSALAILALGVPAAFADAPYGNNDKNYNLRSSDGIKKLFNDNSAGGHG